MVVVFRWTVHDVSFSFYIPLISSLLHGFDDRSGGKMCTIYICVYNKVCTSKINCFVYDELMILCFFYRIDVIRITVKFTRILIRCSLRAHVFLPWFWYTRSFCAHPIGACTLNVRPFLIFTFSLVIDHAGLHWVYRTTFPSLWMLLRYLSCSFYFLKLIQWLLVGLSNWNMNRVSLPLWQKRLQKLTNMRVSRLISLGKKICLPDVFVSYPQILSICRGNQDTNWSINLYHCLRTTELPSWLLDWITNLWE